MRFERIIRTLRQFLGLTPRERTAREKALDALGLMRSEGHSASAAARESGTSVRQMHRYLGEDVLYREGHRLQAARSDRLYRTLWVFTTQGMQEVGVHGSAKASEVSRHWQAMRTYLEGEGTAALQWLEGKLVGGFVYETNPDRIEAAYLRGDLDAETIYARLGGAA